MLVLILLLLALATRAHSACLYNCSCSDDSSCEFYCSDGRCQYSIPLLEKCSGYEIHPRECGKFQWCNPATKQCERGKQDYWYCQYDYECISGYCSVDKGLCQHKTVAPVSTIISSVIAGTLFLIIIIIIVMYQKRISALKKKSMNTTINTPNVDINTETKPPSYGSVPRNPC